MRKVAYNNCFGGFGISTKAVLLGRKLSNNPKWAGCILAGEKYDDGTVKDSTFSDSHHIDLPRHDSILIQIIEQLGNKVNSKFADIRIQQVEHKYRIDEYDGNESVYEPSNEIYVD